MTGLPRSSASSLRLWMAVMVACCGHLVLWSPAAAFSVAGSVFRRTTMSTTALAAGFATDAYLTSLSKFQPMHAPSSTAAYLDSLADFSAHVSGATSAWEPATSLTTDFASSLPFQPFTTQAATTVVLATATPDDLPPVNMASEMLPPPDSASPLASQLSDMSYTAIMDAKPGDATRVAKRLMPASNSKLDGLSDQAWATANEGLSNGLHGLFGQLQGAGEALYQTPSHVMRSVTATESKVAAQAAATVQAVGEKITLTDLGAAVTHALANLGTFTLSILNLLIEVVSDQTLPDVVAAAQGTARGLVDGAMNAVAQTMADIGDKSVADAAQSFVALVILLAKVLFKLLNGIIHLATGKHVVEWGAVAAGALSAEANKLGAAVVDFGSELSRKSLAQLISLMFSFVDQVGTTMVASAGTTWEAVHGTTSVLQTLSS